MEKPRPLYAPAQLRGDHRFRRAVRCKRCCWHSTSVPLGRGRPRDPVRGARGRALTLVLYVGYQRFYERFPAVGWAGHLLTTVVAAAGLGRLLGEVRGVEGRRGWLLPMALCVVNLTAVGSYASVRARTMFPRIEMTGGGIVYYGTGATAADAQHVGDWMEQSLPRRHAGSSPPRGAKCGAVAPHLLRSTHRSAGTGRLRGVPHPRRDRGARCVSWRKGLVAIVRRTLVQGVC